MIIECEGNYTEALKLYDEILEKSPLHALTIKRKACIYKATGKTKEYIAELGKVLEINAGDIPTWIELSEVYISSCDFEVIYTSCDIYKLSLLIIKINIIRQLHTA